LFECSFDIPFSLLQQNKKPVKMGRPVSCGEVVQPVGHFSGVKYAGKQMDIDWMDQHGLSQAMPPAYAEYLGRHLMSVIQGIGANF